MDKFTESGYFLEGKVWIPKSKDQYFKDALTVLEKHKEFNGFRVTSLNYHFFKEKPPTLINTNEFTKPFQDIVDTYSIPKYREINPGLFTVVSFPFLFGIMFGDLGHGLALFLFGLLMFVYPKSFNPTLYSLRSMLTLMGFFAFYCGLIYNDFLAVGFPLKSSCYKHEGDEFIRKENCVYPVGLDYTWHHSSNGIGFVNSFKMKLSIVFGVVHMLIGILIKGLNCLFSKDFTSFTFEFLPQIIFMTVTFGYMVLCIVLKWLKDFSSYPDIAPSIITLFINFVSEVDEPIFDTAD